MSIITKVTSTFGKQALALRSASPQILFGAGVAGFITTTVLAAKATMKLSTKLEPVLAKHEAIETAKVADPASVTKKDEIAVMAQGVLVSAKAYLPTVVVGAATLALFGGAHYILTKRNIILTGTLLTVEQAFEDYRQNVRNDVGELKDLEYRFGPGIEREIVVEGPNGPETKTVREFDPKKVSMYARVFSKATSKMFEPSVERNQHTLLGAQNVMTAKLNAQGYLILNDVYEALGLSKTNTGMIAGWKLGEGDDFVSFGLEWDNPSCRDFVNGVSQSLLLDFNCRGSIFGKLPESFYNDDVDHHAIQNEG